MTYQGGLRIKLLREAQGLSQDDLARRMNLVPSIVIDYEENRRSLTDDGVTSLCRALGVSIETYRNFNPGAHYLKLAMTELGRAEFCKAVANLLNHTA